MKTFTTSRTISTELMKLTLVIFCDKSAAGFRCFCDLATTENDVISEKEDAVSVMQYPCTEEELLPQYTDTASTTTVSMIANSNVTGDYVDAVNIGNFYLNFDISDDRNFDMFN